MAAPDMPQRVGSTNRRSWGVVLQRWIPVAVLLAVMAVAVALGWHRTLSLKTIGLNYYEFKSFIAQSPVAAVSMFVLAYILVVALSLPGALIMTLTGGLLLGWLLGSAASVLGASIGATLLFVVVTSSFGSALAGKAGPFVARLRDGFQDNALSYLLFLRLVPVFPFCIVNLVPALVGVPLWTFVLGTVIGIIPGTVAFSLAGAGLGNAVEAQNAIYQACLAGPPVRSETDCPYVIDFASAVTPELIYGGIAIGCIALVPALARIWSKRNARA